MADTEPARHAELVVVSSYRLECRRCGWRSRSLDTAAEIDQARTEHQHRTECEECHSPYDEDSDAWGLCARCWTIYSQLLNDGPGGL